MDGEREILLYARGRFKIMAPHAREDNQVPWLGFR
jgi:hypothetical protein